MIAAHLLLYVFAQNDNDCGDGGIRAGRNCAQLFECKPIGARNWRYNTNQRWYFSNGDHKHFIVHNDTQNPDPHAVVCLGNASMNIVTSGCQQQSTTGEQEFHFDAQTGRLVHLNSSRCVVPRDNSTAAGTSLILGACSGAGGVWKFNAATNQLLDQASNLCIDTGSQPDFTPPCGLGGRFLGKPFCDTSLSIADRVKDYISRISLNDKLGQFGMWALSMPSVDAKAWQWWSESLHGVAGGPGVKFGGEVPYATQFPEPIGLGASWNRTLVKEMAVAISDEGRAMANVNRAGLTFWAPNVNIFRDPRWGRGMETAGEDPTWNGIYGEMFVKGMQEGEDTSHLKVSSCLKHYDAYSLEHWKGVDRVDFDAIVCTRDLKDTYLPAFQRGVQEGRASGLMCSYNAVNGVPTCASKGLLNDLARGQWGFEGYITSDCGAVGAVEFNHHYTKNDSATAAAVLKAGMDNNCDFFLFYNVNNSLNSNDPYSSISIEEVDMNLAHMFDVQFRLGVFDPPESQPYLNYTPATHINTPAHQDLALRAALQSMVLLKNEKHTLPFRNGANAVHSVAVIGPHSDATQAMLGNYYGKPPFVVSPLNGLGMVDGVTTNHVEGCGIHDDHVDPAQLKTVVAAAASADATVLFVGIDGSVEGEGEDRQGITLAGGQLQLIEKAAAAAAANGKSVVVVVLSGGCVDVSAILANENVQSIIWAGYPGQSGGTAIAKTLFGVDGANPGGRLPVTWYASNYTDQVDMFDMGMRPNASNGSPGRTYRFFIGQPVLSFGTGLSYSTFTEKVQVTSTSLSSSSSLSVSELIQFAQKHSHKPYRSPAVAAASVTVENTGELAGDHVVILYAKPPPSSPAGAPIKSVVDFTRVHLMPGQSTMVHFNVSYHHLILYDDKGDLEIVKGKWTFFSQLSAGGSSQLAVV